MQEYKILLDNGYNLVVVISPEDEIKRDVHVGITDSDDVWNQDLVRISNKFTFSEKTGAIYEKDIFEVQVFANEKYGLPTNTFDIKLFKDNFDKEALDNEDEDDYDDEDIIIEEEDEVIGEESDEKIEEDADKVLKYGDKGEEVKEIQRRLLELGYFNGTIGGNYLTKTQTAVKEFQTANGLQIDGICDKATYDKLFDKETKKKEVKMVEGSAAEPAHGTAKLMDWWTSDIQKIFAKGVVATITDVETGLAWKEQRRGGTNHADVQPCTAADTAALKKAYGGKWSWNRRAIFVTIDGVNYAASMNGMPHGGSSIKNNNFDGHHCIHYLSSRTHCSNKVCPNHQKMVKKAAAATLE